MRNSGDLSSLDLKILRALQSDAQIRHADLATKVGSSTASCWRRIRALEQKGILGASVRLLSAEKMNISVNIFCHVRMRSHAPHDTESFEAYVRDLPDVMECYSMSGDWDYLLRVVAVDVGTYEVFLRRRLLSHASVATASSHFALSQTKYTTCLPI